MCSVWTLCLEMLPPEGSKGFLGGGSWIFFSPHLLSWPQRCYCPVCTVVTGTLTVFDLVF